LVMSPFESCLYAVQAAIVAGENEIGCDEKHSFTVYHSLDAGFASEFVRKRSFRGS
jgi:hypothetical protein